MAGDSTLPSPGDVLAGKYRIERLIGRGGMGAVFAAEHMLLSQRVAVKLLLGELASSQEATNRFMNEARAAAQIRGEHVARVLDIGQLPAGTPYMVLEFLEGSDLAEVLHRRGVLSIPEVADYALQALDALGQAHAAGIVHRDLKPANLFLAKRHDGTSVVKVLDFGISKTLAPIGGTPQGLTSTRAILGSPEYMSPEQLRTPRGVDARTDIWSLGVILYELLTARMPFKGEALGELFMQIMESNPAPVRSLRAEVPAALDAVVMRCLSRDPNARFQNVGELAEVLKVFASDQMRALMSARGSAPGVSGKVPVAETVGMATASTTPPTTPAPWGNSGGRPNSSAPWASVGANSNPNASAPWHSAGGNPSTAAPWANTGGAAPGPSGIPTSNPGKVIGIGAAALLLAAVSTIGVMAALKRGTGAESNAAGGLVMDTSAVASGPVASASAGTAPSAAEPALAAAKAPALPTPNATPTSTSTPTPTPNAGPTDTTHPGWIGKLAKPGAAPAPPAPTAAATGVYVAPLPPQPAPTAPTLKSCSPNYYFDKDGRKHFKPECF